MLFSKSAQLIIAPTASHWHSTERNWHSAGSTHASTWPTLAIACGALASASSALTMNGVLEEKEKRMAKNFCA